MPNALFRKGNAMTLDNRWTKGLTVAAVLVLLTSAPAAGAVSMLVSDTINGRVLQYQVDGGSVTFDKVFAQGSLAGQTLANSMGMTLGADGWVYVGEQRDSGRLLRFAPDGTFINVVTVLGGANRPESVEAGPDGHVYVTDAFGGAGDRVFRVDVSQPAAAVSTFIPQSGTGYSLNNPRGISFGPNGNAFVSDRNNNRVLEFDGSTGALVGTFVASVSSPQDAYWHQSELYVSSGNTVRRYDSSGVFQESFTAGTGGSFNIGVAGLEDAIFSANYSDDKVYRRVAPGSGVQVVPAGGEPGPALNGPGHVLLYQPGPVAVLNASEDAFVNSGNPGSNYGSDTRLRVGDNDGATLTPLNLNPGDREAFVKFDLSGLESNLAVTNALFRAIQTDTSLVAGGFDVYAVEGPAGTWSESTITWNNRPTGATFLGNMGVFSQNTHGGISTFFSDTFTQLVQDWIDGTKPNNGLLFRLHDTGANNGDTLAARESTVFDPPQLFVTYVPQPITVIPEPGSLLVWSLVGLGAACFGRRSRKRPTVEER